MTWRLEPTKTVRSTIPGTQFGFGSASESLTSSRSGRTTTVDLTAGVEVAAAGLEDELPDPDPAAGAGGVEHLDRHRVRDPEEVGDEQGRRALVDLARGPDLVDPAAVHDRDPVAHAERLLLVVGDEDEGRPDLLLQRLQLEPQLAADFRVERAERLVEEQQRRAQDQRPGQGDALLLATGELVRAALAELAELDQLERLLHPPAALARGRPSGSGGRRRRCRSPSRWGKRA